MRLVVPPAVRTITKPLIDIWHLLTDTETVSWDVESHPEACAGDAAIKFGSPLCAQIQL